ncbi:MAG: glycosyltransferase [Alphaproteobacteria bacterium]|nr:glycosyltransferase [Alphaproteobacteria bacterium]
MPEGLTAIAAFSLLIWLYLALFHGRYWRADQRLPQNPPELDQWPAVAAIIPARDEADVIGETVRSLLNQDYPGKFNVVVVDDRSTDGTAEVAQRAADEMAAPDRFAMIEGASLPQGWSGKLWALDQGVTWASQNLSGVEYFLLTDADIAHDRLALRRLTSKAVLERHDLVSLMVLLHCKNGIERFLIPAFVYFFQQLYPFPEANQRGRKVAAAAGGCMLVRRPALERVGGIQSIRSALIDDCTLAAAIKATGTIWIGLAEDSRSIRPYDGIGEIWDMVARTAYTQLRYSPLYLVGTVFGLIVTYLGPVVTIVLGLMFGAGQAIAFGVIAWAIMIMTYAPTLKLYRLPFIYGLVLPFVALLYTAMTIDSAKRHWEGRGGAWKGRTYTNIEGF